MISDRCCLLPGSSVGRNGVLGSGTLAEQDRHYGADCLTIGAADGRCIVLNEGSKSTPPVPGIPEAGDVDHHHHDQRAADPAMGAAGAIGRQARQEAVDQERLNEHEAEREDL